MMFYFDFEKNIEKLELKIEKLKSKDGEEEKTIKTLEAQRKEYYKKLSPWQKVQLSRHPDRPYFMDYLEYMAENFIELHGDRALGEDPSIIGGLATIDDRKVMVIGQQKGRTVIEKQQRNFGMSGPAGFRKARRLMQMAEKFGLPVIKFIDTPGAALTTKSEEEGVSRALASIIKTSLQLATPMLSVIIGEGTSAGAMSLAVSDRLLILEHAWFSVISPEQCASLLWKKMDKVPEAASQLKLCPTDLKKENLVDMVIKEPVGGAHRNPEHIFKGVKKTVIGQLNELAKLKVDQLLEQRTEKYLKIGQYREVELTNA